MFNVILIVIHSFNRSSQPAPLSWKWMDEDFGDTDKIVKFKNFYVFEGREIFDFIRTTVLKKLSPICQIDGCKTSVYKLATSSEYLCISEETDLDQAATITDLLTPWLSKAENVFVFTFKSAYSYNTDTKFDKRCFIRTISNNTIDIGDFEFVAPMEDCNIIYGVSAGGELFKSITIYRSGQLNHEPFVLIFQFPPGAK